MDVLSRHDVAAAVRSGRLLKSQRLTIICENAQAIAYRDLIELYLALSLVRSWQWVDPTCRTVSRQALARVVLRLLRDAAAWPFLYWRAWREVVRLAKRTGARGVLAPGRWALYIRSDHWFGVKSGGSVGHVRGVIEGLRSFGYDTWVVSTDHLAGVEGDSRFYLCVPVYELGRNLPECPVLLYNEQLLQFIRQRWADWAPSFVYQRYSLGNYAGVVLKQRYGVPYVCEYNGSFPWIARHWEKRRLFHERLMTRIELLNLHAADLVVVVSRALKEDLVARGIEAEKILVNPNGVDPVRYSPTIDGSFVRSRYGLDGKVVLGFVGTFGRWHGAEVLAEAFGRLLGQYPEYRDRVRLLMIGDGLTRPETEKRLAHHGAAWASVFTGMVPQEDAPAYLAACDILVSPHVPNPDGTPFFGSPTKLFEYMAMGKGIVASRLEQVGEVLSDGETALLAAPGDPDSLMQGLRRLIDDDALRARLGAAARRQAVARHTWHEHTQRIVEALEARCR